MDSLITAAAQALAAGDPLGALKRVALRDDAPALALRGIAMAQLGDFARAKELLRSAARTFSPKESVARARCVVAEAEIALASRDLGWPVKALDGARVTPEKHGDRSNAAHARYLEVRRLVLIGRLDEAERLLADFNSASLPPALRTTYELMVAGIAIRRLQTKTARAALARAEGAARLAGIPALTAEVESAFNVLRTPAARLISRSDERLLLLEDVEAFMGSKSLVVDACRNVVRDTRVVVSLVTHPVLFALARTLGEAWPDDVPRDQLLSRASIRKAEVRSPPSHRPGGGRDSGLAWAEGTRWVGQYMDRKIHQINPDTGAILRTIESNRFVTGVTWVDGELWHATSEGDDSEIRRISPRTRRRSGAARYAARYEHLRLGIGWQRSVLLRRTKKRKSKSRPPASARQSRR